ncbi:hypothetical protein [Nesterenkonia alba]|nr:hypothetical protein [Nesterenkonia alba]
MTRYNDLGISRAMDTYSVPALLTPNNVIVLRCLRNMQFNQCITSMSRA